MFIRWNRTVEPFPHIEHVDDAAVDDVIWILDRLSLDERISLAVITLSLFFFVSLFSVYLQQAQFKTRPLLFSHRTSDVTVQRRRGWCFYDFLLQRDVLLFHYEY